MNIYLNKLHYPVTVLGPGRRIGLWVQGCSLGCAGCMSRDTWEAREHTAVALDEVVQWCIAHAELGADGITISGGEPFEQPDALGEFVKQMDDWRNQSNSEFDILCYSGMRLSRLERDFPSILAKIDALIPEPFQRRRSEGKRWRGSDNQPLITLSELGKRRYQDGLIATDSPEVQVGLVDGKMLYIGIPRRGELDKLQSNLRIRGIDLEGVSWLG